MNVMRTDKERAEAIPDELVEQIKKFNYGDMLLYEIAHRRFWEVASKWSELNEILPIFKSDLRRYQSFCTSRETCFGHNDLFTMRQRIKSRMKDRVEQQVADYIKGNIS